MSYIEVQGKKLYYEEYGAEHKKTLLYLHGGPGASCADFRNQAKAISQEFHVISFDQLGVLRSDAISESEPYGMQLQIEMCEELRQKLSVSKWALLGHSYGGMLAVLYAYRFPQSISAILYECPSFNWQMSAKTISAYMRKHFESICDSEGQKYCDAVDAVVAVKKDFLDEFLIMLNYVKDPMVRNYLHGISFEEYNAEIDWENQGITNEMFLKSNTHFAKLRKDGKMFDNFLLLLKDIQKPSLLMTGRYDPVCREEMRDCFLTLCPQFELEEFANSGHFPRLEEPEKFTETVCTFLRRFG